MTAEQIIQNLEKKCDDYLKESQKLSKDGFILNPYHTKHLFMVELLNDLKTPHTKSKYDGMTGAPFDEPLEYGL